MLPAPKRALSDEPSGQAADAARLASSIKKGRGSMRHTRKCLRALPTEQWCSGPPPDGGGCLVMRPSMLVVTSLVLAAGFVAGCGGKKEPEAPEAPPPVVETPAEPTQPVVDAPPPTPPAEPPLV